MGTYRRQLYGGVALASALSLFAFAVFPAMAQNELGEVTIENFRTAEFNEKSGKPEFILYGKEARSEGVLVHMRDVRVELLGEDGKTLKAVITTPEADYDRADKVVRGKREVKCVASNLRAEGVGFDAREKTQMVHIRGQVKAWILSQSALFAAAPSDSGRKETETQTPPGKSTP